jgi:LysM repeat protein
MSPEPTPTKLCPVCGTRLAENATRCVVCGSEFSATPKQKKKMEKAVQPARMPSVTLSLPVALGLLAAFLVVGAGGVYFSLKTTGKLPDPTISPTVTTTPTLTLTPTETLVPTETATVTPEPPLDYTVQSGDTCGSIALLYGSSVPAIIELNHLNSTCTNLRVGQVVKVPKPTATPPPPPTQTLEPAAATRAACEVVEYTVQSGDSLSTIAKNYGVSQQAIKDFNGLSTDSVFLGSILKIPLCQRAPTAGPSPTPTTPPPYPAPNLLLPADGAMFTVSNESVVLQWASIGSLRQNEMYQVTVLDVTDLNVTSGSDRKIIEYVNDTKFIVPSSFRPQDNSAHTIRWWVTTVRQTGSDDQGNPIWASAGAASVWRDFSWSGSGAAAPTPTK